jgi:hypothetical protein
VSKPESLNVDRLEDLFEDPAFIEGSSLTRVVLGELKGAKLARIKRVSTLILGKELDHRDYFVDLALPHDRFPEITTVLSSAWKVTPQAATAEQVTAEYKPKELFAVYHSKSQPQLESPADIFNWYDNVAEQQTLGAIPDISPNIYTAQGMKEIVKYGSFHGVDPSA